MSKDLNTGKPGQALRFNKEKVDVALVPPLAIIEEAKVWQYGEKKYGRHNWKKMWGDDTIHLAMGCLLRHAYAIQSGKMVDDESGYYHAAHIRANAAIIIEYLEREKQENK